MLGCCVLSGFYMEGALRQIFTLYISTQCLTTGSSTVLPREELSPPEEIMLRTICRKAICLMSLVYIVISTICRRQSRLTSIIYTPGPHFLGNKRFRKVLVAVLENMVSCYVD